MKEVTGYKTAITRKAPPAPLKFLKEEGYLRGDVLDYGCGKGTWFGFEGYDPYWNDKELSKEHYDTIYCGYVLNVVTEEEEQKLVQRVYDLLASGGVAYFAVRRDIPKSGAKGKDCWQRWVEYGPKPIKESKGNYAIYEVRRVN